MNTSSFLKCVMTFDSDSDEEEILHEEAEELQEIADICREAYGSTSLKHGASIVGLKHVNRNQFVFHKTLMQDYFNPNCTYGSDMFRRRYHMRDLFLNFLTGIQYNDKYFIQKLNTSKTLGLSSEQKMTALRMLAYGTLVDALDDAYRLVEMTVLETFKKFYQSAVDVFNTEYLRSPNDNDVVRIREMHKSKGWSGMLESLNLLFTLGQNTYEHGYYLGDEIYPKWSTIVKTCPNPITAKQEKFAAMQEGQKKDVERDFVFLQSRFAMISNPCRLWSREKISRIMFACIILHNMIIEDEMDMDEQQRHYEYNGAGQMPEVFRDDVLITEEAFNVHVE